MTDRSPHAVVLDIEGTTTSISFVYDAMFPFIRRELERFLTQHWSDSSLDEEIALLRTQSQQDVADGCEGAVVLPETPTLDDVRANVLWQMNNDRKTTGLKALQGRIWKAGFTSGELKGHVFEDVPKVLETLHTRGIPVYIYSSGSVGAQKLLFGYSEAGDLTPLLAGHFDTNIGNKKQSPSYTAIAEQIGVQPAAVTFVTDIYAEAVAAREAGMKAVISIRPGNAALPQHDFPTVTSLQPLVDP